MMWIPNRANGWKFIYSPYLKTHKVENKILTTLAKSILINKKSTARGFGAYFCAVDNPFVYLWIYILIL